MATYAIGDIQGCNQAFQKLLGEIRFDPAKDKLWILGDSINRGPDNIGVLQWILDHRDAVLALMGNHEIGFLQAVLAKTKSKKSDTTSDLLNWDRLDEALDWIKGLPFYLENETHFAIHAGIHPSWCLNQAREHGDLLQAAFADQKQFDEYLKNGKVSVHNLWSDEISGAEKVATLAFIFCRMRALSESDYRFHSSFAGELTELPKEHLPWYAFQEAPWKTEGKRVLFGHWAAHGVQTERSALCLDSGCVWGGQLTAYCLETGKMTQVQSVEGIPYS